jgi:hypothetical protein
MGPPSYMWSVVDCNIVMQGTSVYHTCTYDHLPEDETSGSKHVEDIIKIKILV